MSLFLRTLNVLPEIVMLLLLVLEEVVFPIISSTLKACGKVEKSLCEEKLLCEEKGEKMLLCAELKKYSSAALLCNNFITVVLG